MRTMPDRYAMPKPAKIKAQPSQVAHVQPPLKGLNLSSKLTTGDPLTAPILTNFVVEDDRITVRAGNKKISNIGGGVQQLIPFYGTPQKMAAATATEIRLASTGALIRGGFSGGDWSFTSYANLGVADYTVMVNGHNGVWSWNGGEITPSPTINVISISKTNPAVLTVSAADSVYLRETATVQIAGATGAGWTAVNGLHKMTNVDLTAHTFALPGVDTSGATGTSPTGVTVLVAGSLEPEVVTAPATATWVIPQQFNIVLSHMNRLWFADTSNLAVYYLPIQQKSGEVKVIPLNALFKRGGTIRAMATWTLDGGAGTDDLLVVFSSNGEAVVYQGIDPNTDIGLRGIYRFDAPMSKHCVINYGGELYVLISTGLVPMSTLMRAESEQLGQIDKAVISFFLGESTKYRDREGWRVFINPSSNRVYCNVPQGATNKYTQLVRHMPRPVWSQWQDLPARCWGWISPYVYFGDDSGNVYQMHPDYLSDADPNGVAVPIRVDVQLAWSEFKSPANKHFKMLRTFLITDVQPQLMVDVKVDYDLTPPTNQPDISTATGGGAEWDVADWDTAEWAQGALPTSLWNGVASFGRVGAVRLTARVKNCTFSITGWDVLFEQGSGL